MTRSTEAAAPSQTAAAPTRRLDWGRVAMVPLSIGFGALSVAEVITLLSEGGQRSALLPTVSAALTSAFYALIVWAYFRRGPAITTSRVTLALAAAPVATFLPFAMPFVATGTGSGGTLVLGNTLLVLGLVWSVWSVKCLDRSLSMVPQARVLVDHGPYSVVRHPLYLGEIVAMLGLALTLGGPVPLVLWLTLVGLQCYRATQEESLLTTFLPGYLAYRDRTARVLPGLY